MREVGLLAGFGLRPTLLCGLRRQPGTSRSLLEPGLRARFPDRGGKTTWGPHDGHPSATSTTTRPTRPRSAWRLRATSRSATL